VRALVAIPIVLLAGCTTDSAFSGYCSVYKFSGGNADPMGLVRVPVQLESELRSQLPVGARGNYICWYESAGSLIAAGRRNPNGGNSGYVFIKQADSWVLRDPQPILLELPHKIEL
jgi:hypothetical protein